MLKKIISKLSTSTKETNKLVNELYIIPKKEKGINHDLKTLLIRDAPKERVYYTSVNTGTS